MELLERDSDLENLRATFREASQGHGKVMLLSGEAGIGKTQLVERFLAESARAARTLIGACDSLFTPRPLGPLYDMADQFPGDWAALLNSDASRAALFLAFLH